MVHVQRALRGATQHAASRYRRLDTCDRRTFAYKYLRMPGVASRDRVSARERVPRGRSIRDATVEQDAAVGRRRLSTEIHRGIDT